MLRSVPLLSLFVLAACNHGGSGSGGPAEPIATLGGLAPDPARSLAYASDAAAGKVHRLDLRSGAILSSRAFQSTTGAVASDAAGQRLAVTLPAEQRLAVLRLPELSSWNQLALVGRPRAITWLDGDEVAVLVDDRLLRLNVRSGERQVLLAGGAARRCLMRHDPFHQRLYLIDQCSHEGEPEQLRVRCLALRSDDPSRPPACTTSRPLDGRALDLHAAWNGTDVLVAAAGVDGSYVLDAATLEPLRMIPGPSSLTAACFNATGTRLYQAGEDATLQAIDLDRFEPRLEAFPVATISDGGLLMPDDGLHLITHSDDHRLDVERPFELQLLAHPAAEIGEGWELALHGPPGMTVQVFVSTEPGYLHLKPHDAAGSLLMDLHLEHTRVLARTEIASNGEAKGWFPVPKDELLLDRRFILQAVGSDPATGGLLQVSNPLVVSTRVFPFED